MYDRMPKCIENTKKGIQNELASTPSLSYKSSSRVQSWLYILYAHETPLYVLMGLWGDSDGRGNRVKSPAP